MERKFINRAERANNPFAKNLSLLLKLSKQTQEDLAKAISKSRQSVSLYCNGVEPDYETLVKIAMHFNTSIDWLLGVPQPPREIDINREAIMKAYALSIPAVDNLEKCKKSIVINTLLGLDCFSDSIASMRRAFDILIYSNGLSDQFELVPEDSCSKKLKNYHISVSAEDVSRLLVDNAFARLNSELYTTFLDIRNILSKKKEKLDMVNEFDNEVNDGESEE